MGWVSVMGFWPRLGLGFLPTSQFRLSVLAVFFRLLLTKRAESCPGWVRPLKKMAQILGPVHFVTGKTVFNPYDDCSTLFGINNELYSI